MPIQEDSQLPQRRALRRSLAVALTIAVGVAFISFAFPSVNSSSGWVSEGFAVERYVLVAALWLVLGLIAIGRPSFGLSLTTALAAVGTLVVIRFIDDNYLSRGRGRGPGSGVWMFVIAMLAIFVLMALHMMVLLRKDRAKIFGFNLRRLLTGL